MLTLRSMVLAVLLSLTLSAPGQAACLIKKFQPEGAGWSGEAVAISNDFLAFSAGDSDEIYIYKRRPGAGFKSKRLGGFNWITELEIYNNLLVATGFSDEMYIIDVLDGFSVQTIPITGPTSSFVRDDVLVVGSAYEDDPGGFANGKATIFRNVSGTWTEEAVIQNDDNNDFDIFGYKVYIHPDGQIYVGAIGAQTRGVRTGAVYVFEDTGGEWLQTSKITRVLDDLDFYGWDLAITPDGLKLIVGAEGREAVFTSDRFGFSPQEFQISGDFTSFGHSVAANNRWMVVGAPFGGPYSTQSGEVFLYEFDGGVWAEAGSILPPDGTPADEFGRSVSISGNNQILIGAPLHPDKIKGAAYLYHVYDCP